MSSAQDEIEQAATGIPGMIGVDHVALTVPDLDEAVRFYTEVIGGQELYAMGPFDAEELPRLSDGRDWTDAHVNVPGARLRFRVIRIGAVTLELFRYERPENALSAPPRNCDAGGHHVGIRVSDIDVAAAYLRARGVTLLEGPIEVPGESPGGPMRTWYFLDPWCNQLELTEYGRLSYENQGVSAG
ncbi:MAG: VOC family protein [Solirubrobacteraceae bacterium]